MNDAFSFFARFNVVCLFVLTLTLLLILIGSEKRSIANVPSVFFISNTNSNKESINKNNEPEINKVNTNRKIIANPHSFDYLINPGSSICDTPSPSQVKLLVAVVSSMANFEQRQVVRSTWGNVSAFGHQTRLVFLLGSLDHADQTTLIEENNELETSIRAESARHGDIVQESFVDSYRNLTLKTVMTLRWAATYCRHAQLVLKVSCGQECISDRSAHKSFLLYLKFDQTLLKVDDDVIVNMARLLDWTNELEASERATESSSSSPLTSFQNAFYCYVLNGTQPIRGESKWMLSREEFADDYFPVYCMGLAYMFTTDLAARLYEASFYQRPVYLEDVSLGIWARNLSEPAPRFVHLNSAYIIDMYIPFEQMLSVNYESIFFVLTFNNTIFDLVWNML